MGCHKLSKHRYPHTSRHVILLYSYTGRAAWEKEAENTGHIITAEEPLHEAEVDLCMYFQRNGLEEEPED